MLKHSALKKQVTKQRQGFNEMKNAEAEKIEKLRDQFKEDREYMQNSLSKKPVKDNQSIASPRSGSLYTSKKEQERKYHVDAAL